MAAGCISKREACVRVNHVIVFADHVEHRAADVFYIDETTPDCELTLGE
jgi:hypothetical protein